MIDEPIRFTLAGRLRSARPRVPSVVQAMGSFGESDTRRPELLARKLRHAVFLVLGDLDGEPLPLTLAGEIAADPAARAAVLAARVALFEGLRDRGAAWLLCPACRRGEVELSLAELASKLAAARAPIADRAGALLPLCLSSEHELPSRPVALPTAARLRFRLPGAAAGLASPAAGGVLGRVDPRREAQAWDTFAPIGVDPPDEHFDWTFEEPGFRATLRLSVALESLDDQAVDGPAALEPLPVCDLLFLDELYRLAWLTPARATLAASVECGACRAAFLPVR
ncbi:MAG: hypothetical protein K1X94_22075 [Sandaracinaceae bacterium]|nr:hypothetical protein [Sandaracinaceae bacterium]